MTDWVLAPEVPSGLRLEVVDANGDPVKGRRIRGFDAAISSSNVGFSATTDVDGRVVVDPAPARFLAIRVALRPEEDPRNAPIAAELEVDVGLRWNARRIELPR